MGYGVLAAGGVDLAYAIYDVLKKETPPPQQDGYFEFEDEDEDEDEKLGAYALPELVSESDFLSDYTAADAAIL